MTTNLPDIATFPVVTTHSKECLAEAIISAVQNFRDDESLDEVAFANLVGDGEALRAEAIGYLRDGLQTCECAVEAFKRIKDRHIDFVAYAEDGDPVFSKPLEATRDLALAHLASHTITYPQFVMIAKWLGLDL